MLGPYYKYWHEMGQAFEAIDCLRVQIIQPFCPTGQYGTRERCYVVSNPWKRHVFSTTSLHVCMNLNTSLAHQNPAA